MDLFSPVKPVLLIVDDSPANLTLLAGLLYASYTVKAVNRGDKALKVAIQDQPDLILLDIMMPDVSGYDVCRQLKACKQTEHIPVIFLTSKTEAVSEEIGMSLGAVDYITRPINPQILLSRIKAHLINGAQVHTIRINNEYLEFEVARRTRELASLQQITILTMASLAEVRDQDTGNHLRRTQAYMRVLGQKLRQHPSFSDYLTENVIDMLFRCAPLHDIGKVGIPDRILHKPGKYEPHEFEIMKTHPTLGRDALLQAQDGIGETIEFLEIAKHIIYSHHEKWDGSGYPQGLVGNAIPIPARLMAVADVYDALISRRIYKPGMSHAEATAIIVDGAGKHFDPDVVAAFLDLSQEFQEIAIRYADSEDELVKKAAQIDLLIGD